jgi:AraC-like DNA-binding protein
MAWVKVPPENHPMFYAALPKDVRVETQKMFGGVAAKAGVPAGGDGSRRWRRAAPLRYPCSVVISPAVFRRLCRARAMLEAEGDPAWTITGVAREVGLSPFHLIRCFRALFGVTPHQFRTNARLERAQQLLGEGRSVTDACLAVGFSSPASFSHLFGRRVGVAPSAYRRRPSARWPAPGCISLMAPSPAR